MTDHPASSGAHAYTFWLFCGCLVLLDQFTKWLAVHYLQNVSSVVLIKHVLELTYVENRGAAFGILENAQWLFILMAAAVAAAAFCLWLRLPAQKRYVPLMPLYTLICAGAIGNMADRILRGYVVDFIYISAINFPVFNLADIYVTVSCVIFVLLLIFRYKEEDLKRIF